jgi:hypothetical protein
VFEYSNDAGNFSITNAFNNLDMGSAPKGARLDQVFSVANDAKLFFFGFSILPCLGSVTTRTFGKGQLTTIREIIQTTLPLKQDSPPNLSLVIPSITPLNIPQTFQ